MSRLGAYVRARLHRRIFAWFGVSIFSTVLVVGVMFAISNRISPPAWQGEAARLRTFASGRFAVAWSDAAARTELAGSIARELAACVETRDVAGRVLEHRGDGCTGEPWSLSVRDPATRRIVGSVVIGLKPRAHAWGHWPLLAAAVAVMFLWLSAGRIARRIARPLDELVRVAREIGAGKLSSRVRLGRHQPGEVGVLADAINDMAMRIERQMGDQRELLAVVSHEVRSPLARLRVLTELARSSGVEDKIADDMEREIVEADGLIGKVLASSRVDFAVIEKRELDAATVAREVLERAGLDVARLTVEPDAGGARVLADPTLLSRALANLVENAASHGGGLTRLVVSREKEGARACVAFRVEDAGPGIAPGEEREIFEPFRRGQRRAGGSVGLGLALVQRIATAHGGHITVENRPQGGAVAALVIDAIG